MRTNLQKIVSHISDACWNSKYKTKIQTFAKIFFLELKRHGFALTLESKIIYYDVLKDLQ
jgi:hypothetical protein